MAENLSFSHLDENAVPRMVDVRNKALTNRRAVAEASLVFSAEMAAQLMASGWQSKKGPILHTAIIAGTQAVKRTADLIPFCHPLPIRHCRFQHHFEDPKLTLVCEVGCTDQTGVEMEALTGATVAALTVYDMCKALGHAMEIAHVHLVEKTGGKGVEA